MTYREEAAVTDLVQATVVLQLSASDLVYPTELHGGIFLSESHENLKP